MSRTRRSLLFLLMVVMAPASVMLVGAPSAMAASPMKADFNGDGWEDLAIGIPFEDVFTENEGAVRVLYGSSNGITLGNLLFVQGFSGVPDQAEQEDFFGSSLATGNFNGDAYADLAIGVPGESVGSIVSAGAVVVLYGSPNGLTAAGSQFWHQNVNCGYYGGVEGVADTQELFGSSLVAGDFDGDGLDDLAIGVPWETADAGNVVHAGAVDVLYGLYGSSAGLNCLGDQLWSQATSGIQGSPDPHDHFGGALAAGDFDNDTFADLVVGVSYEDHSGFTDAGAVNVIYGTSAGLDDVNDDVWLQGGTIQGTPEPNDFFGHALAAGDFDGDGFDDLAIGVPYDNLGGVSEGTVQVLYGSANDLSDSGDWMFSQYFLQGQPQSGQAFGYSLAAGDFDGDLADDLAVGVPWDNEPGATAAGAVNVIYGEYGSGLVFTGNQLWHQGTSGIPDSPQPNDLFGRAVGVGDFDGDGAADLSISAPFESQTDASTGVVHIIMGVKWIGLTAAETLLLDQSMLGDDQGALDHFGTALSSQ